MKPESSLQILQQPAIGLNSVPVQSSPRSVSLDPRFHETSFYEIYSPVASPHGQNSVTRASLAPREVEVANTLLGVHL